MNLLKNGINSTSLMIIFVMLVHTLAFLCFGQSTQTADKQLSTIQTYILSNRYTGLKHNYVRCPHSQTTNYQRLYAQRHV